MSCPTVACICMQTIFSCIGLYILLLTIKPCRQTMMHYLTGFQPTSYSLTVISASVSLCLERGIPPCMPITLLVNSQPLERVYSYKHLGIQLTSDLSWSAHIPTLCSKARQQIGMLYHKVYRYSDVKRIYVAFIRPNLEYATAVWDPHLFKDIQKLSILHAGSVPKDGMMPIVTCCTP